MSKAIWLKSKKKNWIKINFLKICLRTKVPQIKEKVKFGQQDCPTFLHGLEAVKLGVNRYLVFYRCTAVHGRSACRSTDTPRMSPSPYSPHPSMPHWAHLYKQAPR